MDGRRETYFKLKTANINEKTQKSYIADIAHLQQQDDKR